MDTQQAETNIDIAQAKQKEHAQDAAARFDTWAETYGKDRISPWFKFYQSLAMSRLHISEGGSFLDVGCGPGWAVREASKHIKSGIACGIDISPKMINEAIARTPTMKNIEFRVANAELIPYPDETFKSVLCTFSFHHYQNPLASLMEFKRVLKQDGKLVILDSARDISFAIWLQDRWRRHFEKSHVKYYTVNEMKALVEQAQLLLAENIFTDKGFMFKRKLFTGVMMIESVK